MRLALLTWIASRVALALLVLVAPGPEVFDADQDARIPWKEDARGRRYAYDPRPWVDAWVRNDGPFYLEIAALGYGVPESLREVKEGFFPGYPWLVRAVATAASAALGLEAPGGGPPASAFLWAALGVSHAAALAALVLLVRLGEATVGRVAARRAGVALAVGPFSFVLSATLSEALYLAATLLAFAAARRGRVLLPALAGGAAAMVRVFGAAIALPLLALAVRAPDRRPDRVLALALVPAGLLVALVAMGAATGDPFVYAAVQDRYGHAAFPTAEGLRDLVRGEGKEGIDRARDLLQLGVLALAALLFAVQARLTRSGRMPAAWLLWSALGVALPLLAGSVVSLPRYAAVVFPFYLAAGAVLPGRGWGFAAALLSLAVQGALFLGFSAYLPLVV